MAVILQMELFLPTKLEHLLDEPSEDRLWVSDFKDITAKSVSAQKKKLEHLTERLFESEGSILGTIDCFPSLFAFAYKFEELDSSVQEGFADIIAAGLKELCTAIEHRLSDNDTLRNCLKALVLFISVILTAKESPKCLKALSQMLCQNIEGLFRRADTRFIELISEIAFAEIKRGSREEVGDLLGWFFMHKTEVTWDNWQAKATLFIFNESDRCIGPIVTGLKSHPTLACEFLRNMCRGLVDSAQTNEGMKNVGTFIEKFAGSLPREMIVNISLIVQLLDCESFSLRNSIIVSMGELVVHLVKADLSENTEKESASNVREKLLEILESRIMDKSSFCRAKVLGVFKEMNRQEFLPRHRFLPIMALACSRLSDSTTHVRKKAMQLLESLIYNNKILENTYKVEEKALVQEKLNERKTRLRLLAQAVDGQIEEQFEGMEPEEISQAYNKEQVVINYLTEYVEMIEMLEKAAVSLKDLLKSKNSSDVTAAIDTLVACNLRGITNSYDVAICMLSLLWNREIAVRKAVCQAFSNLYLNLSLHTEEEILSGLVGLVEVLTPGKLCSLEDLFNELIRNCEVNPIVFKRIWGAFKASPSPATACLLRMGTFSDPDFLLRRYDTFISKALGHTNDWETFRECLVCFERLGNQGENTQQMLAQAMQKLLNINNSGFFSVAEQFVKTAYAVSNSPLTVLKVLLCSCMKPLIEGKSNENDLARAIFVSGSVAMKVVIHADIIGSRYKKEALAVQSKDDLEEISGGKAAIVDQELAVLRKAQEDIVNEGPIGLMTPIILKLVGDFPRISTVSLQKSVVLSMGKMMCINSMICEKHIGQYLNIGDMAEDEGIRSSIVIAFGDLVMRHPNLIEKYSNFLFMKLKDNSAKVKKKAMLVISHLVLNDMIKMKGLIGEVLQGILDKDIKKLSLIFLQELHQKEAQTIYNLIPDAVSRLQAAAIPHNSFKKIADELFKYIDKERQGDNLIDKLSHRFVSCTAEEATNVAYCMEKLPISEKGVRKLLDQVSFWQPLLIDNTLMQEYFGNFLAKARRNWKPESKALLEELEAGIRGDEDVIRKRKVKNN